jgi:hypothetical protein
MDSFGPGFYQIGCNSCKIDVPLPLISSKLRAARKGGRYRESAKIDALRASPTPRSRVRFGWRAILQSPGFEDEDDDEDEYDGERAGDWRKVKSER